MEKRSTLDIKESSNKVTGSRVKTEREIEEETNIMVIRQALEALNSGDISRIHEYISPHYLSYK